MDRTYWHKQTPAEPLFPDLLWSRPENRRHAGKLLIVGGNAHGFAAAAECFAAAEQAGIGSSRVLLPDSLQKTVGRAFEAGEYAASTPSGSFSQLALANLLDLGSWADAVLLGGDFGRNSETAIVLEQFSEKYAGQLTFTGDALDYFGGGPGTLLRPQTTLALTMTQLQRVGQSAHFPQAFTHSLDLLRLIDRLHEFTKRHPFAVVTQHLDHIIVALAGEVSTTKDTGGRLPSDAKIAAYSATWWLQNPSKPFEALSLAAAESIR